VFPPGVDQYWAMCTLRILIQSVLIAGIDNLVLVMKTTQASLTLLSVEVNLYEGAFKGQ
jgi:hypothetical protein